MRSICLVCTARTCNKSTMRSPSHVPGIVTCVWKSACLEGGKLLKLKLIDINANCFEFFELQLDNTVL